MRINSETQEPEYPIEILIRDMFSMNIISIIPVDHLSYEDMKTFAKWLFLKYIDSCWVDYRYSDNSTRLV